MSQNRKWRPFICADACHTMIVGNTDSSHLSRSISCQLHIPRCGSGEQSGNNPSLDMRKRPTPILSEKWALNHETPAFTITAATSSNLVTPVLRTSALSTAFRQQLEIEGNIARSKVLPTCSGLVNLGATLTASTLRVGTGIPEEFLARRQGWLSAVGERKPSPFTGSPSPP